MSFKGESSPGEVHQNEHNNNLFKDIIINLFKNNNEYSSDINYGDDDDDTTKEENYRIAICQDGKFAVTFDTGKKIIINFLR